MSGVIVLLQVWLIANLPGAESAGGGQSLTIIARSTVGLGGSMAAGGGTNKWPYFDDVSPRNVTAVVGQSAELSCHVKQSGDRTVSWMRKRDLHILTSSVYTYTGDARFSVRHPDSSDEWRLKIAYVQPRDAGIYECQINTEPKLNLAFDLRVEAAQATIREAEDVYAKKGSTISLTCVVNVQSTPPSSVSWHQGASVLDFDSPRGGISLETEKTESGTTSKLLLTQARLSDSGNYTCIPSNAKPAWVLVHVLDGVILLGSPLQDLVVCKITSKERLWPILCPKQDCYIISTMIKENELFLFLVTHIEIEGQYLKIWAQTDEMVIQSVNKMLISLQDKFDYCQNNIASPNNVMPHTQCCARGPNNEFSRAKILGFRSDGMVLVQFVDYGNVIHIPIHNIRLLDNMPGAEYLFSVPYAATCFILADVMPIGGTWLQEVVKQIRSFLVNNSFQGIYREMNGCKILKFSMMNEDFSSLLVNRNMALFSTSQSLRMPHQAKNSAQESWRVPAVQQQQQQHQQKVVKNNSFKAIQLEIGSLHDVQVSYVDEGPCKFSVQLLKAIPYLETMMKSINSRPHIALQESPIAGTVCLGQQTHPQRLCRVVLNSPGDTSCKVYYADYGHHEVLPFSSLYQIPDEFFEPNIFSIRFTLNGISSWDVSQEMKDYFGGMVANKNLKLRVCKGPLSPLTQYCDLYLNGKSVKDILSQVFPESCELLYREPKQLQIGAKETVMVPFVESTAKFFVQIESDEKFLDDVMEQVEQASKTAAKLLLGQVREDMPCIALYDDQKWYRASILQIIDDTRISVFYVDYGNQEVVMLSDLRSIPAHLVNALPKQAIRCSLNGHQLESANSDLIKKFENLVLEERMILVAIDNVNGSYIVNLHDAKYINDPMADIGRKLRAMDSLHNQANVKNQDSLEKYPVQPQRFADDKSQLLQKPGFKNKNVQSRENWNGASNWSKDKELGLFKKNSSFEIVDNSKSKFRKDNENEQRHDNRFRRDNSDYQMGAAGNRFARDYSSGDRFNRSNEPNRINSRLDRSYGSDRDSDTSSKSGGKRNNRHGKQTEDQNRVRDSPPNRNRTGRWENDRHDNEPSRNGFSNHNNADVNNKTRTPPRDSRITRADTTKSNSESKVAPKASSQIPPPNITAGAVKNCIMVYYNNPTSFYLQLCPDNDELNLVMGKIYSAYERGGKVIPSQHIRKGLNCIAQWQEDQQWYRAVVKDVSKSAVTVHFIDYGNIEVVSSDKIKEIQPELMKLPAQAIHCKLFCPAKSDWTKEQSEQLANAADDKSLEAEFVTSDQGVYDVLLKDAKTHEYLNDMFANGIDLLKEKEMIRNRVKSTARGDCTSPEYASPNDKWLENKVDFGKTYSVNLAWFINPQSFYFQLQSQQKEFRDMMNEMQVAYAKRQPTPEPLQVGSSVIAVLPEDGVLYRATIVGLDGPLVQYVDYGDRAIVDARKIYPVEKKFMALPKQALFCGLKNVAPVSESNWSNVTEIGKFFSAEKFDCVFHELQSNDLATDQYLISLNADGVDVGNALVQNGLAVFSSLIESRLAPEEVAATKIQTEQVPKIDVNLLEGQTLHVKVSNVEGVNKFYVQFYMAKACQQIVNSYMSSKDPQVMPVLLSHEVCLGAGCLIHSKGKWRRGVVVNFTKSCYDVRLIDTGEHEKVTLNSMLKLPGQLSAMQNQAVECCLLDVPQSSKADDTLKSLIDGKDVKILVEKVERKRLMVRLFDMNGIKIKIIGSEKGERISPICNMPILSSSHEVIVTNVKNSSCLWLQRSSDATLERQLLDDMYEYYSTKEKVQAMPIEKELFAGRWSDGNWYRVIVLELRGSAEVKVQLMDYGDTGYILATDLRTLDPRFHVPHQLAIRVSLSVTLSGSNDRQIELLEPMVKDKRLLATLYNVNRKWIAELSDGGDKLSDKLKATTATPPRPLEHADASEMLVGERYDVVASHVDAPDSLWLQQKEEQEALYDLHDQMQQLATTCPDYEGVPEEKSLCLAMYSLDGCWYRAEVIDADADITTVRFVDYGNTDVIDNGAGRIKHLPDKWKLVKRYAVAASLDVLVGYDWSEQACVRIKELTFSTTAPLRALIIGNRATTPLRVDLLLDGDKSICELLVAEQLATYPQSSDPRQQSQLLGLELLEEEEEEEEEEENKEQFDPRSAFVSHFVSVDEFWVQEEAKVKELEMVADRLVVASMCPPLQVIEKGTICIAHYPEDNQYYRAIVLYHDDDSATTKVSYIDYGNSAFSQDLRIIPEDLAVIPPLSRRCCLVRPYGLEQWPDSVNAEFDKLAANGATVFIMDVVAEGETFLVQMTHDSKDVATELLRLCAPQPQQLKPKERPAPIGEEDASNVFMCQISSALSPTEFWIQKRTDRLAIDGILKRLSNSELLPPAEGADEGKLLAVRYPEEELQCYRCEVLSKTDAGIRVRLVDTGALATVHSDTLLRELPDDLAHIPALAIACTLNMPKESERWSESACKSFKDFTAANQLAELRFEILDDTGSPWQPLPIALYYKDQNIAELLLKDELTLDTGLLDPQDATSDSAVRSETEQHSSKDTIAQIGSVTNDLKVERVNATISLGVEDDIVTDDYRENQIPSNEDKRGGLLHQIKDAVADETEAAPDGQGDIDGDPKSLKQEKIVPGSISRGLSVEEIARYSPVRLHTCPEEKIVPGSINKGRNYETGSVSSQDDETIDKVSAISDGLKSCENERALQLATEFQAFSFDDKIVPSCISRGEEPVQMNRPVTPKTAHSEKLVAGAVNAQSTLDFKDEETIFVEVEENIPDAAV